MENAPQIGFYFDYLDPLSYLVDRELSGALEGVGGFELVRLPLELRTPPQPLLDPDGPWWRERWRAAVEISARSGGPDLRAPGILPWTRKAHEFVAHARARGMGEAAHAAVFEAVFARGSDIGRVDVLVGLGRALGLDPTETKAVLDVDRYGEEVASRAGAARAADLGEPPVVVRGERRLRGFHNGQALRSFLLY